MGIKKKFYTVFLLLTLMGLCLSAQNAPVGSITMWAVETVPADYLECNGQAVSRATYSQLFAVLGTRYGAGDGNSTFNLPDFRGMFPRGRDNGAGVDPDASTRTDRGDGTTGDAVGTKQDSEISSHSHTAADGSFLQGIGTRMLYLTESYMGTYPILQNSTSALTANSGGNESRPKNISMIFIIKAK